MRGEPFRQGGSCDKERIERGVETGRADEGWRGDKERRAAERRGGRRWRAVSNVSHQKKHKNISSRLLCLKSK